MITKLIIKNYKRCKNFTLKCNPSMNILVGDNECGKSTILEALNLVLTRRLNGRIVDAELTPHLFHTDSVAEFVGSVKAKKPLAPPKIVIEAYLDDDPALATLKGKNNEAGENAAGIRIEIVFNDDYRLEYTKLLEDPDSVATVPVEYFRVSWTSFAGNAITRNPLVRVSYVDATTIRLQSGSDYYLHGMITDGLETKSRVGLALAFRQMKETFAKQPAIETINAKLGTKKGILSAKDVTVAMDMTQRGSWETSLTPHLGDVPYSQAGKGEQNALKIMFALDARADAANVVLIEEPENHLSFSSLTILLARIAERCTGKQVFITTHSAYVLNKLGLSHVVLLHDGDAAFLTDLAVATQSYFQKLSGYDTLRLILAKRSILVEGPSDELVVQKAYLLRHGKLPTADGIDVINVRGLSFPRFLDIAGLLKIDVSVVTDNDARYAETIVKRYAPYSRQSNIKIFADPDNSLPTLENHIGRANDVANLNIIFGTNHATEAEMVDYMKKNKTESALALFETAAKITIPPYVWNAVQ